MNAPQRCNVVFTAILCIASPAWADSILEIPVINPGAESGNLTGWTDPNGSWQVSQLYPAREGILYFATEEYISPSLQRLEQTFDVRAFQGSIIDIHFSVSMAAHLGFAQAVTPEGIENWYYYAIAGIILKNEELEILRSGGPAQVGRSSFGWEDRSYSATRFPNWEDIKNDVAYVTITLGGAWYNPPTLRIIPDPPNVTVIDVPTFTAFDQIALSLTIPEPASLLFLTFSALILSSRNNGVRRARRCQSFAVKRR